MKKSICLFFHVHQSTRLRQYRFFDIGKDSHYYDDFANRTALRKMLDNCYLPANTALLEAIRACKGKLKVAFAITGSAIDQFERYAPEIMDSFKALADTGCVEFVGTTYNHSLASLSSESEFRYQVTKHRTAMENLFGYSPKAFCNTELVYSDAIGASLYEMGFETVLTEGANNILGWKSPNYVYSCDTEPRLNLLLRNISLSNDVSSRFSNRAWSEYPLTAEKYCGWLSACDGDVINLFMDYDNFGGKHDKSSGILDFLSDLPGRVLGAGMQFLTPSQTVSKLRSVCTLPVETAMSWYGDECDVSAWLGNELQQEAFNKLYGLAEKLAIAGDPVLWADFGRLQECENLYYMNTRFFSDGEVASYINPYPTPYEAFINYMNVLSDFIIRVNNVLAEK